MFARGSHIQMRPPTRALWQTRSTLHILNHNRKTRGAFIKGQGIISPIINDTSDKQKEAFWKQAILPSI